jgi:hypothetical protein
MSNTKTKSKMTNDTFLIPNEINEVTHDLANELKRKLSTLRNQENALTIANYLIYMKNEINCQKIIELT